MRLRRWLDTEDDVVVEREPSHFDQRAAPDVGVILAVLVAALAARLVYLFFFSDPQNAGDGMYGDTYHHWQIAYLTKEVGLGQGVRLWDLKGLEYFWGVVQPVLLVPLFFVTGSADIVVPRLLSIVAGSLDVVLVFLLTDRYFGRPAALGAAVLAGFTPIAIFNDSAGLTEPLGVLFALWGLWLLPARGFRGGLAFALAAMARAEAWIFGAGLIVATALRRTAVRERGPLVMGWGVAMIAYMGVLMTRTGNPLYPLYWNFVGNAQGRWVAAALTNDQLAARPYLAAVWLMAVVGLGLVLWRRPPSYLFLAYGLGYTAFVTGLFALTAYISAWNSWYWFYRSFEFAYQFAGVLVAVALLWWLPQRVGRSALPVAWGAIVGVILVSQLAWSPIQGQYHSTEAAWRLAVGAGTTVGNAAQQVAHGEGAVNIPADHPDFTYTLVHDGGVPGRRITGQLYDAFYGLPSTFRYSDHRDTADVLVRCWLSRTGTSIWVVPDGNQNYREFLAANPGMFRSVSRFDAYGWSVVAPVGMTRPSDSSCRSASSAALSLR